LRGKTDDRLLALAHAIRRADHIGDVADNGNRLTASGIFWRIAIDGNRRVVIAV
jgi:hypothetical protein